MVNSKQSKKRGSKISKRALELRAQLWPDLDEALLWKRTIAKGFTTIPRTFPHMLDIMDDLAGKGTPVSKVYLSLWCRVFDEGMLELKSYDEMAYEAGFSGQRAVTTWKQRMSLLVKLGFIFVENGIRGEYDYVLILNPYPVIKRLYEKKAFQKQKYIALFARAQEIGATDLQD